MEELFRIGLIVCAYFAASWVEKRMNSDLTMKKHSRIYHRIPILWLTSQKPELLNLFLVHFAAFHGVDSRGIHARMSQNIGKTDDVLLQAVIGSCKKVS